jgi:hypothetical protein
MLTAGLVLAMLVEWVAVHRLGRWAYAERMPMVPGLGIGLVPIAQMIILPPIIFRMAAVIGSRHTIAFPVGPHKVPIYLYDLILAPSLSEVTLSLRRGGTEVT